MNKNANLKKPWPLQILIYSFLFAPFGNIALTAATLKINEWYTPAVFYQILISIQPLDLAWLTFTFFSGVLLLAHHKTAWSVAISSLVLGMLFNFRNIFDLVATESSSTLTVTQTAASLVATLSVGIIFFYFRYPYLDRRTTVLGYAGRVDVKIPSRLQIQGLSLDVDCESISITGARFCFSKLSEEIKTTSQVYIQFSDSQLQLSGSVVDVSNGFLRVKFMNLRPDQKSKLIQMVRHYRREARLIKQQNLTHLAS